MNQEPIYFLSTNKKKKSDALFYGFQSISPTQAEHPEIYSPSVEQVALYKAFNTELDNIVVEDTSLTVEGLNIYGTEIKHIVDSLMNDDNFHNHKAVWAISLCVKTQGKLYSITEQVEGILQYPPVEGYNFEKIFCIKYNNKIIRTPLLTEEQKLLLLPRYKALAKLKYHYFNNTMDDLQHIDIEQLPLWTGNYQVEEYTTHVKNKKRITI